jgi:hypothetical protein
MGHSSAYHELMPAWRLEPHVRASDDDDPEPSLESIGAAYGPGADRSGTAVSRAR